MAFDTSDQPRVPEHKDARSFAQASPLLSEHARRALQGALGPSPADSTRPPDGLPPDFQPQVASTDLGYGKMVETGTEKPEVKHFHDIAEEGLYGESSGGRG